MRKWKKKCDSNSIYQESTIRFNWPPLHRTASKWLSRWSDISNATRVEEQAVSTVALTPSSPRQKEMRFAEMLALEQHPKNNHNHNHNIQVAPVAPGGTSNRNHRLILSHGTCVPGPIKVPGRRVVEVLDQSLAHWPTKTPMGFLLNSFPWICGKVTWKILKKQKKTCLKYSKIH